MLISEYMLMNIMRKYTAYVDIFISYSIFLLNACNQVVLIHLFLYHCESRSLVSHFIYSQAYFKVRLFKSPVSMERFCVCVCVWKFTKNCIKVTTKCVCWFVNPLICVFLWKQWKWFQHIISRNFIHSLSSPSP